MFEISSLLTSRLRNPTLERKKEEKNSRVHKIARVCTWQGEPRARDIAHSRAHLVVPVLVAEDAWVAAESSASEIRVHLPCVQKEREKNTITDASPIFRGSQKPCRRRFSSIGRLERVRELTILFDRSCSRWDSRNEDEERESERFGKAPGSRYRKFRRIVMQHLQRGCK